MKTFSLILIMLICIPLAAQDTNKKIMDDLSGKMMLTGYTTREAFSDTSFSWWFKSVYDMYTPDSVLIPQLKEKLPNAGITIIMGSWCSDSRREVPRLFKILDEAGYPSDSVKIISVDRDKKAEDVDISKFSVELVPTIIFYDGDKEMGRITESPKETLEKDMIKILDNKS